MVQDLSVYVKASNGRPCENGGTLDAPGLPLLHLGRVVRGPVPVFTVRDGTGRWRRVRGIYENLGAARRGMARAYLVENDRGREVWVVGGQLGLWFAGGPTPLLYVEVPGEDLPATTRKRLQL